MELMYFGYDGKELENKFILSIKKAFPNVSLQDAYDEIKGYRQEVAVPEGQYENLKLWLLANGWFVCSFTLQTMKMDDNQQNELKALIEKAIEKYPDKFKDTGEINLTNKNNLKSETAKPLSEANVNPETTIKGWIFKGMDGGVERVDLFGIDPTNDSSWCEDDILIDKLQCKDGYESLYEDLQMNESKEVEIIIRIKYGDRNNPDSFFTHKELIDKDRRKLIELLDKNSKSLGFE